MKPFMSAILCFICSSAAQQPPEPHQQFFYLLPNDASAVFNNYMRTVPTVQLRPQFLPITVRSTNKNDPFAAYLTSSSNQEIGVSKPPNYNFQRLMPAFHTGGKLVPKVDSKKKKVFKEIVSARNLKKETGEKFELSQFHSQDSSGRSVFGFTTPGQARVEARNYDGTVRGSYTYLDAHGKPVQVHYWDDGNGFHSFGNNVPTSPFIPEALHDNPQFSASKEHHLKQYKQALQSALITTLGGSPASNIKDQDFLPLGNYNTLSEEDDDGEDYDYSSDDKQMQQFAQSDESDDEAVVIARRRSGKSQELAAAKSTEPGSGFFYSYLEPIPVLVEVQAIQKSSDVPVSQKAAYFGSVPVAAVHDTQVHPRQRGDVKDHQTLPLYVQTPTTKQK